MNIERMEKVIQALESLPDERLDMGVWRRETECGTVCCAAGAYIMANPDADLVLVPYGPPHDVRYSLSDRQGRWVWDAISLHFDIDERVANDLFSRHPSGSNLESPARLDVISNFRKAIDDYKRRNSVSIGESTADTGNDVAGDRSRNETNSRA